MGRRVLLTSKLILSQVRLLDAWRLAHPVDSPDGAAASVSSLSNYRGVDESKRIDYILFKGVRMSVSLEQCDIAMNKVCGVVFVMFDFISISSH
ncbi:hypothetical protein COOONC_07447 [Cooperia oncophora]